MSVVPTLWITRRRWSSLRNTTFPAQLVQDAHAAFELGKARLSLPQFEDANGLRIVIPQGQVKGGLSPISLILLQLMPAGEK